MKNTWTISLQLLLICCIVLSTMLSSFVMLNYQLNKSQIIEKFCVNKDKPEMKCHGKCHMKDQLKKSEESKQKNEETVPPVKPLNFQYWAGPEVSQWNYFPAETELNEPYLYEQELAGFPPSTDPPPRQLMAHTI